MKNIDNPNNNINTHNNMDPWGHSGVSNPFVLAAIKGEEEVIKLIKEGKDINARDKENGKTALMQLVTMGKDVGHIRLLLKYGAEINLQDKEGNTALMLAVKYGELNFVEVLLKEYKADPNIKDKEGKTPLMRVGIKEDMSDIEHADHKIIALLLDNGADAELRDNQCKTALMNAAENKGVDVIKEFIIRGVDIDIEDPYHRTAEAFAQSTEVRQLLQKASEYKKSPAPLLYDLAFRFARGKAGDPDMFIYNVDSSMLPDEVTEIINEIKVNMQPTVKKCPPHIKQVNNWVEKINTEASVKRENKIKRVVDFLNEI